MTPTRTWSAWWRPCSTTTVGRSAFGGPIVTVKCFEDNSVIKQQVAEPGDGRVMVVDGGGSLRCALLGDMLAAKAMQNNWAGLVIYGCIRDVDEIADMEVGVQSLNAIPIKSVRKGVGELNVPVTVRRGDIQSG